jgi:hypothetical protein
MEDEDDCSDEVEEKDGDDEDEELCVEDTDSTEEVSAETDDADEDGRDSLGVERTGVLVLMLAVVLTCAGEIGTGG